LFQIDQLLCKPRDRARFDFWDFVLPKNGVIFLKSQQSKVKGQNSTVNNKGQPLFLFVSFCH
jgi:hypothetical protein